MPVSEDKLFFWFCMNLRKWSSLSSCISSKVCYLKLVNLLLFIMIWFLICNRFPSETSLISMILISLLNIPQVYAMDFAVDPLSPVSIHNFIPASLKSWIHSSTSSWRTSSTPVIPINSKCYSSTSSFTCSSYDGINLL